MYRKKQMADDTVSDLPVKEGTNYDLRLKGTSCEDRVALPLTYIAKLGRGELEDRFFQLYDDNIHLKKTCNKQEEKIKKLAAKLLRVVSDRKSRLPTAEQRRAVEADDLISEQALRISELEQHNAQLQDRVVVLKHKLIEHSRLHHVAHGHSCGRSFIRSPSQHRGVGSTTATTTTTVDSQRDLVDSSRGQPDDDLGTHIDISARPTNNNQEQEQLLDEVKRLRQQNQSMEQEIHVLRERTATQAAELEEELANDTVQQQRLIVAENVELIRMKRMIKQQASRMLALQAHSQTTEHELVKMNQVNDMAQRENEELQQELMFEKQKVGELQQEVAKLSSYRQAVKEMQEEIRDYQKEKMALKDHNNQLIALSASSLNAEQLRQQQASEQERALRAQLAELQSSLATERAEHSVTKGSLEEECQQNGSLRESLKELELKCENLEKQMKDVTANTEEILHMDAEVPSLKHQNCDFPTEALNKQEESVSLPITVATSLLSMYQQCVSVPPFLQPHQLPSLFQENDGNSTPKVSVEDLNNIVPSETHSRSPALEQLTNEACSRSPALEKSQSLLKDISVERGPTLEESQAVLGKLCKSKTNSEVYANDLQLSLDSHPESSSRKWNHGDNSERMTNTVYEPMLVFSIGQGHVNSVAPTINSRTGGVHTSKDVAVAVDNIAVKTNHSAFHQTCSFSCQKNNMDSLSLTSAIPRTSNGLSVTHLSKGFTPLKDSNRDKGMFLIPTLHLGSTGETKQNIYSALNGIGIPATARALQSPLLLQSSDPRVNNVNFVSSGTPHTEDGNGLPSSILQPVASVTLPPDSVNQMQSSQHTLGISVNEEDKSKLISQLEMARELEKCREMLRVQYNLNSLYKKEMLLGLRSDA